MTKALFHLRQFRLLLLILLCALFSLPLSAQEAYIVQSKDESTLTFYYDAKRQSRSGRTWGIDEKSYDSIPVWSSTNSSHNRKVEKVVFHASFKNYRPTTTNYWFSNFKALITIRGIENLNTSEVTEMNHMFYGCSSLKELNVSNFNTSEVTDMSKMFSGCSSLKELNVSNFNTSEVTDMSAMFGNCSSLKELNVSNFNTSEVTNMKEMFTGCSGLKELNVSNFNTSAVRSMGRMFSDCSSLTFLNLSNFNTSAVMYMWRMFSGCSGLTSLNLSNFNTSAVKVMSAMFENCSGLKTIINPNTWRCEESQDMFKGCTQLKGAVMYDESKLEVEMANPKTGYFSDSNKKNLEAYVQQSEDQQTLTFFYDTNLFSRSGKTWYVYEYSSSSKPDWTGNKVITKVVFDTSFKDFRPTTTKDWFYKLSALTTIEGFENLNTSAVTNMRGMFSGCSGLTSLNLSNFNTSAVTDMSGMFFGCSGLTSLNLSNLNTSAVTNMREMFSGCSGLTSLNLSNLNTSAVTNMSAMFGHCSGLTSLNLSNFNTSAVTNMSAMFYGCSGLTSLNLSNLNTSKVTNMSGMFS